MSPKSEIGHKGFKKTGIKRKMVKRLNESEYKQIVINRAKNGEEIGENDLGKLIGEKLETVKNFTSYGWYPVVDDDLKIINFASSQEPMFLQGSYYDYTDWENLEFNEQDEYFKF